MKIWGDALKVTGVYDNHRSLGKVDKSSGVSSKKDVLSISNQAKDFQSVMKSIREVPDIRQDKVSELVDKYEAGNYNVSGNDIADKILNSMAETKTSLV